MDPDFMAQVLQELGLGEVPAILNDSNKAAHDQLIAKQLEIAKFKALNAKVEDSIARLFGHITNIQESLTDTKNHKNARRDAELSERDLRRVAQLLAQRNSRELRQYEKVWRRLAEKNEKLREDIATRSAINELMEDEHITDIETVNKWTDDVDEFDENINTLMKFQHQDEIRIKEYHLKLEKLRQRVKNSKTNLDSAATDSKMAQLCLDKTAEEFRVLHQERQVAIDKWKEATDIIEKRDEELQKIFSEVNDVKSSIRNHEIELQEQMSFLANENSNITELEKHFNNLERQSRKLSETLEQKEKELEELDSSLTIEKRQIWRVGAEISTKRARLNQMKKGLKRKIERCEQIGLELELTRSKKLHFGSMAMTSEEKSKEMQRMLDKEEGSHNFLKFELDKLLEKKLANEKRLKDLKTNEESNNLRIRGLNLEIKNLSKHAKTTRSDLAKKEDIAIANNYTLSQIEREIAELKGTQSETNRAQLKEVLHQLKAELENRLSDKRNLDHLVHKMAADVRKVRREIESINVQQKRIKTHLEEVTVTNESCMKEHEKMHEKMEALLLEQQMLKLTEKRAKENLEELNNDLLELKKQDLQVNEKLLEQRADAESQREVFAAQLRCLKDELSTIRGEIRERKDRAEKLKLRYNLAVKALGSDKKEEQGEKLPSHARHLVVIAQEKAELVEQSEVLSQRISKEEKELAELESAMALLKTSNDQYRETNLRQTSKLETEEIVMLKNQVRGKEMEMKKLQSRVSELEDEIRQNQFLIQQAEKQISNLKRLKEDKNLELTQVEKDLSDYEQKLNRSQRVCASLAKDIREKVANANIYEIEMNMRLEKENQRAALMKLKELSALDPVFSAACQREMETLGLTMPVATRLELMSSSSSNGNRTAQPRSTTSTNRSGLSTGSLFRHRSQSSSDRKSTPQASVLVMELNPGAQSKNYKISAQRG